MEDRTKALLSLGLGLLAMALPARSLARWYRWTHRIHGPRVEVVPVQLPLREPAFRVGEFTLEPVASYELRGALLNIAEYTSDPTAAVSPLDFAVGWGVMSDDSVLDRLRLGQTGRFFLYGWYGPAPMSQREAMVSSSNNHLIPATEEVRSQLYARRAGERVVLRGRLVDVRMPGGGTWRTSRVRDDTNNGACEILYVESVALYEP